MKKSFFIRYKDFFLILILLVSNNLLNNILGYNELTLLSFAKQFYNPNWIPNDFALSSKAEYQITFNYFAGWLSSFLTLSSVAIFGRVLLYMIFALAMFFLNKILKLNSILFLFAILLFFGNQSVIAGEWMVKGFEFKTLAYSSVFFALYNWLNHNKKLSFLFFGLGISFHVLIGGYSFVAFIMTLIFTNSWRELIQKNSLKAVPILIISSIGSWKAIFGQLFLKGENISQEIIDFYIKFRVSGHLLPSTWNTSSYYVMLLYLTIIFITYFIIKKDKKISFLYIFFASNLFFFSVGIIIYELDKISLLKYYWFRTSDVFSCFFFAISLAFIAQSFLVYINNKKPNLILYKFKIEMLFLIGVFIFSFNIFIKDLNNYIKSENFSFVDNRFPYLNEMYLWINRNTPKSAGIICSPYYDFIYVMAERRTFVNYKTGPAEMTKQKEWFNRLILLNNNINIPLNIPFSNQWESFENNFNSINEKTWLQIAKENNFQYLLMKSWVKKEFEIAYKNEAFILYKLN